jgi:hypothetical protein
VTATRGRGWKLGALVVAYELQNSVDSRAWRRRSCGVRVLGVAGLDLRWEQCLHCGREQNVRHLELERGFY